MSSLEYCRICRRTTHHAILHGTTDTPNFNCCQSCGDCGSITPEPEPIEEEFA
jgi:MinD superfamily P-loop ATPase